jgi:hypothetical protein
MCNFLSWRSALSSLRDVLPQLSGDRLFAHEGRTAAPDPEENYRVTMTIPARAARYLLLTTDVGNRSLRR